MAENRSRIVQAFSHAGDVIVGSSADSGAPFTGSRLLGAGGPGFTVGQLAALTAPGSILTAASAGGALTAVTAAASTLTAGDQRTGGPG